MKKLRTVALFAIISIMCGCTREQQPLKQEVEIPVQYNLMDYGRATEMASQDSTGMCWAYAALNAAESNLITSGLAQSDLNLSEAHLVYYMYEYSEKAESNPTEDGLYIFVHNRSRNSHAFYIGNISSRVIGKLANGMGPVLESEAPFQNKTKADVETSVDALIVAEKAGKLQKYMGNYLLKEASYYDMADRDTIKTVIMEKGAMELSFFHNPGYYTNHCAFYYPKQMEIPNHAVSLIGWDDTYPKENFGTHQPPNDGAWLVFDSAAFAYGGDGYLWISYEDPNLIESVLYDFCERSAYGDILYHDAIGSYDSIVTAEEYTTVANVFQVNEAEEIKAVGIYTLDSSRQVEVSIYTGVTEGVPESGDCQVEFTVTPEQAGYHVIDLEKTIPVGADESCSVVVKYCNDDGLGKAPVEGSDSKGNAGGTIITAGFYSEKGQSYGFSGGKWFDLSEESSAAVFGKTDVINNACIKLLLR